MKYGYEDGNGPRLVGIATATLTEHEGSMEGHPPKHFAVIRPTRTRLPFAHLCDNICWSVIFTDVSINGSSKMTE